MSAGAVARIDGDARGDVYPRCDEVLARARVAQEVWARVPVAERARRLEVVGDSILARQAEIVAALREENGKAEVEAVGHEIGGALSAVRHACRVAPRLLGSARLPVPWLPHRRLSIERVPFGVCVVLSPWNFPFSIPLGQVVAAVVGGNAVVLKPSEYAPRVGALVGAVFAAADLPQGLVQVVQGDGRVGAALIAARPDRVAFTGSVATGRKVMAACAQIPIPVSLELGGVDALIVCEDADIELATSAALWGATFNGGQVCASVERILVHERMRSVFVGRLLAKVERLDPRDLGPCVMPAQGRVWDRHVEDARKRGLTVLSGGAWQPDRRRYTATFVMGAGIAAAVLDQEETFGPIATIHTFADDAEAARLHNATDFGLTASVYTEDPARGARLAGSLKAGIVSVNDIAGSLHAFAEVPWGGRGASGFGRSHGDEGLRDFTWPRVLDQPARGVPGFKRPWWYPYDPDQLDVIRAFVGIVGDRQLGRRVARVGPLARSFFGMMKRSPRI